MFRMHFDASISVNTAWHISRPFCSFYKVYRIRVFEYSNISATECSKRIFRTNPTALVPAGADRGEVR